MSAQLKSWHWRVHGLDFDLNNASLRGQISAMLREVGNALGKQTIEIEHNGLERVT